MHPIYLVKFIGDELTDGSVCCFAAAEESSLCDLSIEKPLHLQATQLELKQLSLTADMLVTLRQHAFLYQHRY